MPDELGETDDIRIILDLPRLGELIAAVADRLTELRGIEAVDLESDEMRELARAGWLYVVHMADRADFARSVKSDLARLEATDGGVSL